MLFGKKIICAVLISIMVFALQACTNKYRVELEGKGIAYTPDLFIDAVKNRNSDVVELFIKSGINVNVCKLARSAAEDNETSLYAAVWNNDLQMAKVLLEHGYNVNKERCTIKTPPLHLAAMRGLIDMTGLIIEKGADVNRKDFFGVTPLRVALQMHREDMVDFLTAKGAK